MKQSIFQKLFSGSSLLKQGLSYGILIWIILQIPISYVTYRHLQNINSDKYLTHRNGLEKLLVSIFKDQSKYGDLVNARGSVLKQGATFGLENMGVCVSGKDITPKINDNRCSEYESKRSIQIFDKTFVLTFNWKDVAYISFKDIITPILISFLISGFLFFGVVFLISSKLSAKVQMVSNKISGLTEVDDLAKITSPVKELVPIENALKTLNVNLDKTIKENITLKTKIHLAEVAKQVAHDIRSPLAALKISLLEANKLSESTRAILKGSINRIEDIANTLLYKNKKEKKGVKTIHVISTISNLITEKRTQYKGLSNIEINSIFDPSAFSSFVKIDEVDFCRALSNLINNAVEAIGKNNGQVTVKISEADKIQVLIQDNGPGIPEKIIEKLGQKGFSHQKSGGSGLGIFQSKMAINNAGGDFSVESSVGVGTKINITLPKEKVLDWFQGYINPCENIVILDDHEGIHHVWDKKFDDVKIKTDGINHFYNANELIKKSGNFNKNTTFLLDFELIGQKMSGLDVAKHIPFKDNVFLVTSRFEEKAVQEQCLKGGIKIIPKPFVSILPIIISEKTERERYDAVLIDDDELVRTIWEIKAQSVRKNFKAFSSPDDFFKEINDIDRSVVIYIDSSLGNDIRGEEEAKRIWDKGFRRIILSTGFEANTINRPEWIEAIVGKDPPSEW